MTRAEAAAGVGVGAGARAGSGAARGEEEVARAGEVGPALVASREPVALDAGLTARAGVTAVGSAALVTWVLEDRMDGAAPTTVGVVVVGVVVVGVVAVGVAVVGMAVVGVAAVGVAVVAVGVGTKPSMGSVSMASASALAAEGCVRRRAKKPRRVAARCESDAGWASTEMAPGLVGVSMGDVGGVGVNEAVGADIVRGRLAVRGLDTMVGVDGAGSRGLSESTATLAGLATAVLVETTGASDAGLRRACCWAVWGAGSAAGWAAGTGRARAAVGAEEDSSVAATGREGLAWGMGLGAVGSGRGWEGAVWAAAPLGDGGRTSAVDWGGDGDCTGASGLGWVVGARELPLARAGLAMAGDSFPAFQRLRNRMKMVIGLQTSDMMDALKANLLMYVPDVRMSLP